MIAFKPESHSLPDVGASLTGLNIYVHPTSRSNACTTQNGFNAFVPGETLKKFFLFQIKEGIHIMKDKYFKRNSRHFIPCR
jgi:hypothetical protein